MATDEQKANKETVPPSHLLESAERTSSARLPELTHIGEYPTGNLVRCSGRTLGVKRSERKDKKDR
jgi:hypothetical protein